MLASRASAVRATKGKVMKGISSIKYSFTVIGFAMVVGGWFMYSNTQDFLSKAILTEGTVVQVVLSRSSDSITYRPVVEFETEMGRKIEFISSSGSNRSSYTQGETVEVLYEEARPYDAKINGFLSLWGGAVIVSVLGLALFAIGCSVFSFMALKDRKVKFLKKNGVSIVAKFQSVEVNSSLRVNGRSPYHILAQWRNPVTSELHIFKSENLWFDPSDYMNQDEITVFVDKENPKKFYVDVSFLPKLAS